MKRMYLILVMGFLMIAGNSLADTLKNEVKMKALTDRIMQKVSTNDLTSAFSIMKAYVPISETEVDAVAIQSKAQREQYGKRYGSPIGFEFISSKKVGESLLRLQYIEKTEKHALPWSFCFYRTSKGWTLNTFQWNDQFQRLFLEN